MMDFIDLHQLARTYFSDCGWGTGKRECELMKPKKL